MSSHEFGEWMAFARREPIGAYRQDYLAAILSSLIANVYRNAEVRPDPFAPDDFLPDWWKDVETEKPHEKTDDEILAACKSWAILAGAKVKI
jgi:hypothetical protein